jgi:hypothetical protein
MAEVDLNDSSGYAGCVSSSSSSINNNHVRINRGHRQSLRRRHHRRFQIRPKLKQVGTTVKRVLVYRGNKTNSGVGRNFHYHRRHGPHQDHDICKHLCQREDCDTTKKYCDDFLHSIEGRESWQREDHDSTDQDTYMVETLDIDDSYKQTMLLSTLTLSSSSSSDIRDSTASGHHTPDTGVDEGGG